MTDIEVACATAKMVKHAIPIGRILAGALVAMPAATYLINRLRGHDPQKVIQPRQAPEMQPAAHRELVARIALQRALLGLEGQNPLLQSARGLQSHRRIYG